MPETIAKTPPNLQPYSLLRGRLIDMGPKPGIRAGDVKVDKVYPVKGADGLTVWKDGQLVTEVRRNPLPVPTHIVEPVGLVVVDEPKRSHKNKVGKDDNNPGGN